MSSSINVLPLGVAPLLLPALTMVGVTPQLPTSNLGLDWAAAGLFTLSPMGIMSPPDLAWGLGNILPLLIQLIVALGPPLSLLHRVSFGDTNGSPVSHYFSIHGNPNAPLTFQTRSHSRRLYLSKTWASDFW